MSGAFCQCPGDCGRRGKIHVGHPQGKHVATGVLVPLERIATAAVDDAIEVEAAIAGLPGLAMSHVEATYLAWIDARGLGVADPAAFFEAAGVGLSSGIDFGLPGWVRLNFGCPSATLAAALERMTAALAGGRTLDA